MMLAGIAWGENRLGSEGIDAQRWLIFLGEALWSLYLQVCLEF